MLEGLTARLSTLYHVAFEKMLVDCGVTIHNTHEYRIEDYPNAKHLIHNDVLVAKIWIEHKDMSMTVYVAKKENTNGM